MTTGRINQVCTKANELNESAQRPRYLNHFEVAMGFGSRMKTTEPSDESANTMIPPVLSRNTRVVTVLLKH